MARLIPRLGRRGFLALATAGLAASLDSTGFLTPAWAKPLPAPAPEEAVREPLILVATYLGYDPAAPKSYFDGVVARYRAAQTLQGTAPAELALRYDFHDHSPCLEPPDWKFEESLLPKPGSAWILFAHPGEKPDQPYVTYRGDYGRWPATAENLARVKKLLAK